MFCICSREAQVIDSQREKYVNKSIVHGNELITPKESDGSSESPPAPSLPDSPGQKSDQMEPFALQIKSIPKFDDVESTYDVEDSENKGQATVQEEVPLEDQVKNEPEAFVNDELDYSEYQEYLQHDSNTYPVADIWVNEDYYEIPENQEFQENWEAVGQYSDSFQEQPTIITDQQNDKILHNESLAFDDTFFAAPSLHVYECSPILSERLVEDPQESFQDDQFEELPNDEMDDHWAWVPPQHQMYTKTLTDCQSRPHTADIHSRPLHLTDTIEDGDEPYEISLYSAVVIPKTTQSRPTVNLGSKPLKRPQSLPSGLIAR